MDAGALGAGADNPEDVPEDDPEVAGAFPPVGGAFSGAFSLRGALAGAGLAVANSGGAMAIRSAGGEEPVVAAVVLATPSGVPSILGVTGVRATPGAIEVMVPQIDRPSQETSFLGKLAYTASPTRNDTGLVTVN